MMIGEIDFTDIFHANVESDGHDTKVFYEESTYAIFVTFLIVLAIIVANLLVMTHFFFVIVLPVRARTFFLENIHLLSFLFLSLNLYILLTQTGLAVDDVNQLRKNARLKKLKMQVSIVGRPCAMIKRGLLNGIKMTCILI